jgi:hypothetical protein
MPILRSGSRGPYRHRTPDRCPQLRPDARRLATTGREGPGRRTGRPDPAAGPRRQAAAADAPAGRAGARGGDRGQPNHGGHLLRDPARRGRAPQQARCRQLDAAARRTAGRRGSLAVLPARRQRAVRPRARRTPRTVRRAAGRRRVRGPGPRRPAGRPRLRPQRSARAARRDRRPLHRTRPPHHARPGAGHGGRGARDPPRPHGAGRAGRPRSRRAPDLPQRARRGHHAWRAPRTGTDGPRRRRWQPVGPRPAHVGGARRRTAARLRHPRLPEPHRRPARRRRPGPARGAGPADGHHPPGRRDPRRPRARRPGRGAGRRARRRRLTARAQHRVGEQDVLGRAADRLDPHVRCDGAQARRRPRRRGPRRAGAGAAHRRPAARRARPRRRQQAPRAGRSPRSPARPNRAHVPGLASVPARRWAEPVGGPRPGRCSRPAPGSAWTGRSSGTCGCRTHCGRTGWTRPSIGSPRRGPTSTARAPRSRASRSRLRDRTCE